MRFSRVLISGVLLLSLIVVTRPAMAQDDPTFEHGDKPYGSFHGGQIDFVNLANGSLNVKIPLISYPQRGGKMALNLGLNYRNLGFYSQNYCNPAPVGCITYWGSNGQNFTIGDMDSLIFTEHQYSYNVGYDDSFPVTFEYYGIQAFDGGFHQVYLTTNGYYESTDASGYQVNLSTCTITDAQGTRQQLVTGTSLCGSWGAGSGVASFEGGPPLREDANGNQILYSTTSGWTDTLNRQIPLPTSTTNYSGCTGSLPIVQASLWNLPGINGGTYSLKLCYADIPLSVGGTGNSRIIGINSTLPQLQSVVLPNSTAWTFIYDTTSGYGDLIEIVFPTGGTLSYTWLHGSTCVLPGVNTPVNPIVASRTLNANDGTGPHVWNYSYVPDTNQTSPIVLATTVTDPTGNDSVYLESNLGISSAHNASGCTLFQSQLTTYQGSQTAGTLLRTEVTNYNLYPGPVSVTALPIRTTTTWPNGQTSKTEQDYDAGFVFHDPDPQFPTVTYTVPYGQVIANRSFDYASGAPGPLLRQTKTAFLWQNNPNYQTVNLLNLPAQVVTYDGNGNRFAESDFGYDAAARSSSGITTQLDPNPTNAPYFGNRTSASRWENAAATPTTICPTSVSGGFLTSTAAFNNTGTLSSNTDPCGFPVSYSYSGTFAGAFPTTITNALNQSVTHSYDFNTGSLTSTTDANGQTTSYAYDAMLRVTQITYPPGGGQTTICYTDEGGATCSPGAPPFEIVTTSGITASLGKVVIALFDGLGRVSQTQLASDPDGATYSLTTYDPIGRVSQVYNPTRCNPPTTNCGESTWGFSAFAYDALSRATTVTEQDGSVTTTSYSGSTTTVTDPAGKSRKSVTDGLGRPTQIFEDPFGLNYETDYTYDPLGNLWTVIQKGGSTTSTNWRTRSFAYDSLSRLLCASNPETSTAACPTTATSSYTTGTTGYTYDANANLLTKTSLAQNQTTSATVTLYYCYDSLNRITGKAYTSQTCPMSSSVASYSYDQTSSNGLTVTNGIGRRTGMTDVAGSEAWSYDQMGREHIDQRTTNASCGKFCTGAVLTNTTTYTYNLDGSVATLTYPTGSTITYTQGGAGRTLAAADNTNNISFGSAAHYAPSGALASIQNGSGVFSTYLFNSRLQPCWAYTTISTPLPWNTTACTATVASGNILDLKYNFNLGLGDNGNVMGITNNRDNTRSQNFTYDSLNRISTAQTQTIGVTIPNPNCWGLTLGYDPWGNLLQSSTTGPSGCGEPLPLNVSVSTANQMVGYSYDAAGNLLNDGTNPYTYNVENQLVTAGATSPPPVAWTAYTYDGDDHRILKTAFNASCACPEVLTSSTANPLAIGGGGGGGCKTGCSKLTFSSVEKVYWYGPHDEVLAETNSSGNTLDGYVFFNNARIARFDSSNNVDYYFADHLGTSRVVTDSAGNILDDSDFYPFGGERPAIIPTSGNTYKFTGKERDSESGLDNFKARYFGSSLGRFTRPDPIMLSKQKLVDPQQWNLYSYARNNPLRFIDPTGMYICSDQQKCAQFEKARQEALKSKNAGDVRAAKAYGNLGDKNGVYVSFADTLKGDRGGTVSRRDTGIEQDPNSPNGFRATVNVTIKSSNSGSEETVVHEGSHVADRQDFVNAIGKDGNMDNAKALNITLRQSEVKAYELSIGYALRGNKPQDFGPCGVMQECKFTPGMMPAIRDQLIDDLLNSQYKNLDQVIFPEWPHQ